MNLHNVMYSIRIYNLFRTVGIRAFTKTTAFERYCGRNYFTSLSWVKDTRSTYCGATRSVHDSRTSQQITSTQLDEVRTMNVAEKCQGLILDNTVVIFSKSTCPYCVKVKTLFDSLAVPYTVYELDHHSDGVDVQNYLFKKTSQKTVPNVFVKGEHVGGYDATSAALHDGSLQTLLKQTPVPFKVENLIRRNNVVIFSKTTCPFCAKAKEIFVSLGIKPTVCELDENLDGPQIQEYLYEKTKQKTVPNVFVRGTHIGGSDDTQTARDNGRLVKLLKGEGDTNVLHDYDYDLVVIGGGSGGLAAAKEAAQLGKKVALCDFVVPSPPGTTWGLGGTCVNVGCIPKKLMHNAALLGEAHKDSKSFGWTRNDQNDHAWEVMVENVQNYIKSLNFGYRKEMNKRHVKYLNGFGEFINEHKIKVTMKNGKVEEITGNEFIIAVGGRPKYPDIPGAVEFGITSDDIFSLRKHPGKTLVVGASYIALECAGFLRGLGVDVSIMVRSILLRGFDRQMSELIGEHLESIGVVFHKETVPTSVVKLDSGKLQVTASSNTDGDIVLDDIDTVLFAVGREACTARLGLNNVQVNLNPKNAKIIADEFERTSIPHIYAIGDVIDGKPELTPVAIHAGRYLARRIAGVSNQITNYKHIPTTVFTPLEYGCVGLSEEEAYEVFGHSNIIVYHNAFKPLEHALSREETVGYAKLICVKSLDELVVGFHVLSPNAGEITQGFAIGLKLGAKKIDFDDLVGIHPTCAEIFTTMNTVKNPGDKPPETTGC